MTLALILYLLSFLGIWFGAGLAISSVERLSRSLRLSSFAISFLLLGFFTSISEFSVGVNAVLSNDPEIFVGNLIGASIVLFMLIIPLLAITGKHVHISDELQGPKLALPLLVIALPVLLSLDGKVDKTDALICILLFLFSAITIETRRGLFNPSAFQMKKQKLGLLPLKILLGVAIIFFSSHYIVTQTMYFSQLLNLSPFFISLVFIAIGTNLPELSFLIRSLFRNGKQVAFGDYVGSAAFNTFLFGILTLWYQKPIFLQSTYLVSLIFLIIALLLFYVFAKSKKELSRSEGLILFSLYLLFLLLEFFTR